MSTILPLFDGLLSIVLASDPKKRLKTHETYLNHMSSEFQTFSQCFCRSNEQQTHQLYSVDTIFNFGLVRVTPKLVSCLPETPTYLHVYLENLT